MKKPEQEQWLDQALAQLRDREEEPWVRRVGLGLEARVRQRLLASAAESELAWNWPSLGFACSVTAAVCLWSGWGPVNLLRKGSGGFHHWISVLTSDASLFF